MNPIQRDLKALRHVRQRMANEGIGPVLRRLVRQGLRRARVEIALLVKRALPFALGAAGVMGAIALLAGLPFGAGLVLAGLGFILFGTLQAAGAHGAVGGGQQVMPRIYEYAEPSWAATDDPDEQRKLWRERREQGISLFAKLFTAGVLLILSGLVSTAVSNAMG